MKKIIPFLFLLSGFLIQSAFSQVDSLQSAYDITDTQDVKITLFDTDDLFEISLKFDITQYKRAKSNEEYLDAVLTYYTGEKDSVSKNIKVRARGNIRRTAICDFPPLLLNFQMKDSTSTEFSGLNKLKLVSYCRIGYEDYVLREFLVYKLFNVLTDFSFRVRLFKITYINTAKEKKPLTQYGFAIEPVSLLEKRTATKEVTFPGITQRSIKPDMLDRTAIFNYMIGNTDWSVPIHHNALTFAKINPDPDYNYLLLPYDFDYSGLVNTDYAVPFETLPIETVRERLYMVVCRSNTEFTSAIKEFEEKKDEFYKVINDFPYLSARSKKDMTNYLEGFFIGIDKRNTLVRDLLNDCNWFEEQANLKIR
jgi:hypothetical protein